MHDEPKNRCMKLSYNMAAFTVNLFLRVPPAVSPGSIF